MFGLSISISNIYYFKVHEIQQRNIKMLTSICLAMISFVLNYSYDFDYTNEI